MSIPVRGPDGKITRFPAGTDDATINQVMSELYGSGEEAAPDPEPAPTPAPKRDGALTRFGRGITRLPQLVGIGGNPAEAAATFAGGAGEALGAVGRGIVGGVGGQVTEDALINAPVAKLSSIVNPQAGDYDEQFERARAYGDQNTKEHPFSSLLGTIYGFGRGGERLRKASGGRMGLGGEAATVAGLSSLGDQLADEKEGVNAGQVATDSLIGMVGAKALEPVAKALGQPLATGAQKVQDFLTGGAKGPINAKSLRAIAERTKAPAEDIEKAYREFVKYNPDQAASFAEIADPATIDRFADMAKLRQAIGDDRMGAIYRNFEETSVLARPELMRKSAEATGDVAYASNVRRDLTQRADEAAGSVTGARDDAIGAIDETLEENLGVVEDVAKNATRQRKNAIRATRDDLRTDIDMDADIREWGNQTLRASGLADQPVVLTNDMLNRILPRDRVRDVLNEVRRNTPESQSGRIEAALEALEEGGDLRLIVDDVDVLRQALNEIADRGAAGIKLRGSTAILADVVDAQAKGYKSFLGQYRSAKEAAEGFKRFRTSFGQLDDVVEFAGRMAGISDQLTNALGPRGAQIVENINGSMNRISTYADEIASIQQMAKNAAKTEKKAAQEAIDALKRKAAEETSVIKGVLADNVEAVNAAQSIFSRTTGQFGASVSRATPDVPLAAVARGAVADAVGESPASAITAARNLSDNAVGDRLAMVAGEEGADALTGLGRTQLQGARNISQLPTTRESDPVLSTPVALALDALGGAAGRPGPGYQVKIMQKILQVGQRFGLRGDKVEDLAQSIIRRDNAAVEQILRGLARNETELARMSEELRGAVTATVSEGPDALGGE